MKKLLIILGVIVVAIIIVVLVKKNKNKEVDNFVIGEAMVSSVSIAFQESFPLGVAVQVEGDLPDACTEIGDVVQTRNEKTGDFIITLQTKKPLDAVCAQVLSAFDTSFVLEGTDGLPKGDYTVIVNGVKAEFTFEVDNFISNIDTLK